MADFLDIFVKDIQKHCTNIDNFNKDILYNIDKTNKDVLDNLIKLLGIKKEADTEPVIVGPLSYNPYND
ncbi:hypothetical protein [Flavobacterium sp.]|jgi:hypothetical protein|uniref:hypothetical protein n=1 Tax=Flavobacterium sp. TaxID=239 RepID=UPI0037C0EF70